MTSSLWETWRSNAQQHPNDVAIVHWVAGEEPLRWRWHELISRAEDYAGYLVRSGVRSGDVCALIIRHNPEFYPLYFGVVRAGALPAVLAYPNARLHPEKFRAGLEGMAKMSGLDWLLTERELEPTISPLISSPGERRIAVLYPLDEHIIDSTNTDSLPEIAVDADAPALLQHSSGTTGLQKGVVLSHSTVLDHVRSYSDVLKLSRDDCVVSWLPLYHDMGLIAAFHLPLACGIPTVQVDPFEWVVAPGILFDAMKSERATVTWLPNFAYNLLADRVHDEDLEGIDLSAMKLFVNCSEPVRAESHERFLQRYLRFRLRRESLAASYAMAEATFAVTQTPPGEEAKRLKLSASTLATGRVSLARTDERMRECVSSGVPLDGCEIRIVDDGGAEVANDTIGEITIRSPYMFSGYRNNPAATQSVLKGDWYFSGDYGFLHEGECYVIGRKKDIIIVAGKNIYPEDIEAQISQVEGVLAGRVVAFGVFDEQSGTEQVWVAAETDREDSLHHGLRIDVVRAAMEIDITISKVVFVPPRWLIKSSAGKPSRRANTERILSMQEAG